MRKLDMGAAWDDAAHLLRAHPALTGAIAALFIFLPGLVVLWLGPTPFEPAANVTPAVMMAELQVYLRAAVPWIFVQSLLSMFASVAIMRLWLGRAGTSVGEALMFAASFFPTIFILQILLSIILFGGFLLFIIPGLYLLGRLSLTSPFVAHRELRNPLQALQASWRATEGNGWRIVLYLVLLFVAFLVISGIIGLITSFLAGLGAAGQMIGGLISAVFGTAIGLISAAVVTALYRQLVLMGQSEVFS